MNCKTRKATALFLIFIMLLLAGCSGTSNPNEGKTKNNDAEKTEAQDGNGGGNSMDAEGKYTEPVELTFSKIMYPDVTLPEGQSPEENVVFDYLKDKYNIEMKMAWQSIGSEYNNKLSVNIASGTVPDIFFCNNYLTFLQLAENDMLADLTDIYEANASDTMKAIDQSFGGRTLDAVTIDGKLLGIPSGNLGYGQDLLWLRKDWLDNLGLDIPETIEDLEKVLTAFVHDDPDGNGVNDTVGLAVDATQPVQEFGHIYGLEPIFYSFGAYPKQWMQNENNEVYYGSIGEAMKGALGLLQDWYQKGLIDTQFPTRIGSGETEAIVTSGQSGAYFGPWSSIAADAFTNNPEVEFVPVCAPLNSDGNLGYMMSSPVSSMMLISKNCKNPEAAIRAIGINNDIYRGFDPEAKKIVDDAGIAASGSGRRAVFFHGGLTLDYYDIVPKLAGVVKQQIESGTYEEYPGMTEYDKEQVKLAASYADGSDKSELTFRAYYFRYIGSGVAADPVCKPVEAAYYYPTDSSTELEPTLDKLEMEMYLKIILGEKPLDYFDEFASQWKQLGGDTLKEEVELLAR